MEHSITSPILITGATGYIASHIIKLLLEQNYKVRGTVRSLANKEKYQFLYELAPEKNNNLEFVEADLLNPEKWLSAVEGVEYVLHVASPFPMKDPKDEDEVIRPAVEGTLNVLKAAAEKGVKKVVVTSSVAAIYNGHIGREVGPEDWSIEEKCNAYSKSKLKAEKAAWEFLEQNKEKFEMATVNPSLVIGPLFASNKGTSEQIIADILTGKTPGLPRFSVGLVDVRDVAECHIKALFSKESHKKRYICSAQSVWMGDIGTILKEEFGKHGYKVTTMNLGKFIMKIASFFDKRAKNVLPELDIERKFNNELSKLELGINYRDIKESLVEMGYSLIKVGVVPQLNKERK